MLRIGTITFLLLGMLSACGHTPEERLASGALIGGAVGAAVGLATEPRGGHYRDSGRRYYDDDRHYDRPRRHHHRYKRDGWRRDRHYDDHREWEYY